MSAFRFVSYELAGDTAAFVYADDAREYREQVRFATGTEKYDEALVDRALFLAFILIGTSYYKVSPTREVLIEQGGIDEWQAKFFTRVYQDGLSQYAYENDLNRDDLAVFAPSGQAAVAVPSHGSGILSLQSGGKDSLLVASLLEQAGRVYTPWYVTNDTSHPSVLDTLAGASLAVAHRQLDREGLRAAASAGGLNGHVPVTYIILSLAVVQAILLGKNTVLAAIAHEGDEPHAWIDDLPVNHQWSKTWQAEKVFADYVQRYISPDIRVGSPLRALSELKVAELFVGHAWKKYGASFSSCNVANYQQGTDNTTLSWCGNCPKCANSYLLFAPFIDQETLQARLGGDLFVKSELTATFKGLLGVDGHMKPFECVGEVDELRQAYHMSQLNGYTPLPFTVPPSSFDKDHIYPAQDWAEELVRNNSSQR